MAYTGNISIDTYTLIHYRPPGILSNHNFIYMFKMNMKRSFKASS